MAGRERAIVNFANDRARFYAGPDAPQLTIYDVRAVLDYYEHHCLFPDCPDISTTLDHVIPLVKRGENVRRNLQPLCAKHNKQKQDETIDYRPTNKPFCPDDYEHRETQETSGNDARVGHDWSEIDREYISGEASTRELAKKFHVPYPTMRDHAIAQDLENKREEYRSKVVAGRLKEIELANVAEGFSAYRATFALIRTAFDDYLRRPTSDKLRAIADILDKGLVLEGYETRRTGLNVKRWAEQAKEQGEDVGGIHDYATRTAETYYSRGDYGGDPEPGAGWTD